ncbi:MAG: hypothetical protein OIF48_19195 [Silicimonas sp.]|nr:hypothetical protein [Silicimonas sp.]
MAHLLTSILAAMITAVVVYIQTGSFGLAFAGYVFAGATTLLAVIFVASLDTRETPQLGSA